MNIVSKVITITAIALVSTTSQAQGIVFFQGSFSQALEKATKEEKLIFMDAYAEWCGPCKRMAATTFKDEKVGKFFNDNFVNIKVDMEKGEGPTLAGKYPVSAYPTLMFINGKGDLEQKNVGALDAEGLIQLAKNILSRSDKSKDLEKAYNSGKRDPDLVLNYIRSLNRAGKPSMKVTNEFLQKADMALPTTLKIIFEGTTQADSRIFDLLIKNKTAIASLFSEQQVKDKIKEAIQKTLETAVQFKSEALHKEAKDKMKMYLPEQYDSFATEANMQFAKATGNAKDYCAACEEIIKKEAKNDARKLFAIARQMIDAFPKEKSVLSVAEKAFRKAAENGGLSEYYYWHAQTLVRLGKNKDAMESAQRALKVARESAPNYVPACQNLIDEIKQQG